MEERRMSRCPECGGYEIDSSNDGLHCKNCGLVIDDTPISNPFVSESKKQYASLPGTSIAGTLPVHGKVIKHYWLLSTREKNLFKTKKQLGRIASNLRLTLSVEKDAFFIFKSAVEKRLNAGWDNLTILYGCIYASCLLHDIPKTPEEIVIYTDIDRNRMLRAYRKVKKGLNLQVGIVDPVDLVNRFASRLSLQPKTTTKAVEIIMKLKETAVTSGKHPKSVVASALYIACKLNNDVRSQRQVANASGVIEVTIRKNCKEIIDLI